MKSLLLLLTLISPSLLLGAPKPGDFLTSGPPHDKRIALTFDDGPGVQTEEFVRLLDRYKVKGTFFMLGEQAKIRPHVAKLVAERGHEVASHTYNHVNYVKHGKQKGEAQAKKDLLEDMRKSRKYIESATGATLKLCRMPHGIDRPWIKQAAKEAGFVLLNWTYGSDWIKQDEKAQQQAYVKAIKPGAVLLFHDGGRHREKSLALTEAVIKAALEQGYEIVPAGKLVGL